MEKSAALFVFAIWLGLLGSGTIAGVVAHDGIPIKSLGNILFPLFIMVIALLVGLLASAQLAK